MEMFEMIKKRVKSTYKKKDKKTRASKRRKLHTDVQNVLEEPLQDERSPAESSAYTDFDVQSGDNSTIGELVTPTTIRSPGSVQDRPESVQLPSIVEHAVQPSQQTEEPILNGQNEEVTVIENAEVEMVDEDQLRTQSYVQCQGEDPSDYTRGLARVVIASDGVEDCAALLLTYDFSQKIQESLRAQREIEKAERVATRLLEVQMNLENDVRAEIDDHQLRLEALQAEHEADPEKVKTLQTELSHLEKMLQNCSDERQRIEASLISDKQTLCHIQAQANAYLEDAFVFARLLEPASDEPDAPIEDLSLQEQYQNFVSTLESNNQEIFTPLDTDKGHLFAEQPSLTEEEQKTKDFQDAIYEAEERLQSAQAEFERSPYDRTIAVQAHFEAKIPGEGTVEAMQEEFDLMWLKREHELTRGIIEAEKALSVARVAALDAGVVIPVEGFGVDGAAGSGYHHSIEKAMIDSAPKPKIEAWRSGIPEAASPGFLDRSAEADEWDVEEDDNVGWNDSVSMVALEAADRKRIDRWNRIRNQ